MRAALPIALAAVLIVGLTGCTGTSDGSESSSDDAAAASCPAAPSGKASDSVKVTGEDGVEPTVTFDSPISAKSTQRTVITEGDGDAVEEGASALIRYSLLNGTTGAAIESYGFDGTDVEPLPIVEAQILPGLYKTIVCSTVGSRVVGVISAADGLGDRGSQIGVGADDVLVMVVDIVDIETFPVPSKWTTDVPEVDLSTDPPTVTLPAVAPPTEFQLAVLEEGDGEVVGQNATVSVDYQGTSWDTGTVFDDSYARGEPAEFSLSGVVPGFAGAIAGQKVGTTFIAVLPVDLAYGPKTGASTDSELAGQTLVFLVHIDSAS